MNWNGGGFWIKGSAIGLLFNGPPNVCTVLCFCCDDGALLKNWKLGGELEMKLLISLGAAFGCEG
jgi:hypothetical protein